VRRRLACDAYKVEPPRRKGGREDVAACLNTWSAGGSRVVMLDASAVRELEEVPVLESLAGLRAHAPVYVAPLVAGGFGAPGPLPGRLVDGFYAACVIRDDAPADQPPSGPAYGVELGSRVAGVQYWPAMYPGTAGQGTQNIGPSGVIWAEMDMPRHPDERRMLRLIAATMAALSDPLWLRKVVVRPETPHAPKRARRRGDPRAQTFDVVRLAPTSEPRVVRYREPVVIEPTPARGRVGRGIRLGAPIPEHDVRGHCRRLPRSEEWAAARGVPWVDGFALVPVKAHVRGKGPRRETLVRGFRR
jgi:hypothetical protein